MDRFDVLLEVRECLIVEGVKVLVLDELEAVLFELDSVRWLRVLEVENV